MAEFRHRGIKVAVDTTETAEFDFADHKFSKKFLRKIAKQFTELPFSENDVCEGYLRARTIDGFDFIFIVGRLEAELVVTIGGVEIHQKESELRKALKIAEKVGIFRGAAGI